MPNTNEYAIRQRDEISTTPFDGAAVRVVSIVGIKGRRHAVARDDYALIIRTLAGFAGRFGIQRPEAEEIAAEAIEELFLRADDAPAIQRPAAYLFWMTRNRIVDRRRRARVRETAETLVDDVEASSAYYSAGDDDVTRLLDRQASAQTLQDALRAASAAGDNLLVRIVTSWISVAEGLGDTPSSRAVASRAEVSHTSVNQALRRLRGYLPDPELPSF